MSIVQRWATSLADRVDPGNSDAALISAGWTVERRGDDRCVSLSIVSRYTAARRERIERGDGDELDPSFAHAVE